MTDTLNSTEGHYTVVEEICHTDWKSQTWFSPLFQLVWLSKWTTSFTFWTAGKQGRQSFSCKNPNRMRLGEQELCASLLLASQTSTSIELEVNNISIFNNVIPSLLLVLASSLQQIHTIFVLFSELVLLSGEHHCCTMHHNWYTTNMAFSWNFGCLESYLGH